MRIHGICEMVINGRRSLQILLGRHKQLQDKVLHVVHTSWIAAKLREVVLNIRGRVLHFHRQQIRLVQEQNYRDALERGVIDYRVEDIPRLLQSIRALILGQHLVKLGGGDEEQNGRHRTVKALGPLLTLRPLAADIDKHKRNVLDANGELVDALGRLTTVQDVLVRRHVLQPRYPVQFVQEITHRVALQYGR